MQKILRLLSDVVWNIRFTFEDGAKHKQFWKEEKSIFSSVHNKPIPDYYSDPKYQIMSCNIYHQK